MFLVRVILFFMSRRTDRSGIVALSDMPHAPRRSHRTSSPRKMTIRDKAQEGLPAEGSVTREEMTRLFGNALRIR
jgi:hypothetical protein